MRALNLLVARGSHSVVAEIVETELRVCPVGDVALVLLPPNLGRLLVLNAADGEAERLEDRPHPLGVAAGEVIVDGDDVHAEPGEGVEKDGQGGHEGLSLPGHHLRDHLAVQGDAADELHVEVHHVPLDGLIADADRFSHEPTGGILHDREGLRQDLVEVACAQGGKAVLELAEGLLGLLDRGGSGGHLAGQVGKFVAQGRKALVDLAREFGDLLGLHALDFAPGGGFEREVAGEVFFPGLGLLEKKLGGLTLEGFLDPVDLRDHRPHPLHLTLVFGADDLLKYPLEHESVGKRLGRFEERRVHTRQRCEEQGTVRPDEAFSRGWGAK